MLSKHDIDQSYFNENRKLLFKAFANELDLKMSHKKTQMQ
jgi:hypothetical protein